MEYQPWPHDAADKIKQAALKFGRGDIIAALDELAETLLGEPERVEAAAYAWSPQGMDRATGVQEDIHSTDDQLRSYWQGPAHEEFRAWLTKLDTSVDKLKLVLDKMRGILMDCGRIVIEVYAQVIELIGRIAKEIVNAIGDLPNIIVTGGLGAFSTVAGLLGAFADELAKLLANRERLEGDFRRRTSEFQSEIAKLVSPVALHPDSAAPGGWQVKPKVA